MNEHDAPQQLTLLPSSNVPVQFRLDADTRRRGQRHVAEIRRLLAERQAARAMQTSQHSSNQPSRAA